MQADWLPHRICDFIDRMTRNFLWKGNSKYGVHLVGCNKITKPKKLNGLGIRKVRYTNTYMLGKLAWGLHGDCDSLWVRFEA